MYSYLYKDLNIFYNPSLCFCILNISESQFFFFAMVIFQNYGKCGLEACKAETVNDMTFDQVIKLIF